MIKMLLEDIKAIVDVRDAVPRKFKALEEYYLPPALGRPSPTTT